MTVDGYHAKVEYAEELDLFQGEILGLGGGADFDGKSINTLAQEALQERVGHWARLLSSNTNSGSFPISESPTRPLTSPGPRPVLADPPSSK